MVAPKYVPAKTNEGWTVAGLVVLLAVVLIVGVTIIHQRTYKHPTDPAMHTPNGRAPVPAKGSGH